MIRQNSANRSIQGLYLCVGLDADYSRIPRHLLKYEDPVYEFNRQIIDATKGLVAAYKV